MSEDGHKRLLPKGCFRVRWQSCTGGLKAPPYAEVAPSVEPLLWSLRSQ